MIKKLVIRYFVNPIIWRYIKGSKRYIYFNQMLKDQWNPLEKNHKLQGDRLYNLIRYCEGNIPYYQKIIKKNKIKYSRDTIFEDIKKFPILTKKILRDEFDSLINPNIKGTENTSGGSTGEQAVFLQDDSMYDHDAATKMLFKKWAGREEGELLIKLWGSEKDYLEGTMGLKGFFIRNLTNILILNTYRMTTKDMKNYVRIINRKRPKLVLGYVQDMFEFARFILENKIKIYSPNAVMTSAGTLTQEYKELIGKTFRCPVFNRYGSREVGDVACDCSKHEGLHLNIFNHYIELLDDKFNDVTKEGAKGEIFVTHLFNYVMPLIRYKIGDMGVNTNKRCSCGRGMPLIKNIEGRIGYTLRAGGSAVSSTALTTSFYLPSIQRYQIIQEGEDFTVKVQINDEKMWEKDKKILSSKLKQMFKSSKIEFQVVDDILPSSSGKFLYFINKND